MRAPFVSILDRRSLKKKKLIGSTTFTFAHQRRPSILEIIATNDEILVENRENEWQKRIHEFKRQNWSFDPILCGYNNKKSSIKYCNFRIGRMLHLNIVGF